MTEAVNDKNFKEKALRAELPVLVDFWAAWCGPCQRIGPIVQEISEEYADQIKVYKLDIDKDPAIASLYDVISIPTLILFDKGEIKERIVGLITKNDLKEKLAVHLKKEN